MVCGESFDSASKTVFVAMSLLDLPKPPLIKEGQVTLVHNLMEGHHYTKVEKAPENWDKVLEREAREKQQQVERMRLLRTLSFRQK